MNNMPDYVEINRRLWNEKTKHHVGSAFYDMPGFLSGSSSLKEIELDLLGDVAGKSVLHLQCHFGQDTLSLARMGAKVTGVDLSDEAIATASGLASELSVDARFICCNLYDLPEHLNEQFDIVFATYGTIGWLPDLRAWSDIVYRYLKPGGKFVFAEFHPVVWMFDYELNQVQYAYFNRETIIENLEGTYADKDAPMALPSVSWNHSLDEVIQNLLGSGLQLQQFREFDHSPYNIFSEMEEVAPGRFQVIKHKGKLPLVYALQMNKP